MNERQRRAITDPYTTENDIAKYRSVRQRGDGSFLVAILAVDR